MKKIFLIGCGVVILSVIVMVVLVLTSDKGNKELVCTSSTANITLTYNNATIVGYTSKNYTYDLLAEKSRAEQIGMNKYIEEISNTFNTNTFGTCTK